MPQMRTFRRVFVWRHKHRPKSSSSCPSPTWPPGPARRCGGRRRRRARRRRAFCRRARRRHRTRAGRARPPPAAARRARRVPSGRTRPMDPYRGIAAPAVGPSRLAARLRTDGGDPVLLGLVHPPRPLRTDPRARHHRARSAWVDRLPRVTPRREPCLPGGDDGQGSRRHRRRAGCPRLSPTTAAFAT